MTASTNTCVVRQSKTFGRHYGHSCAATVLDRYGSRTCEREMTRLCLTNRLGTSPLGLYRGMTIKTRDTAWDVEIFRCSVDELRRQPAHPRIIFTRLSGPKFAVFGDFRHWGWSPPMYHSVVLLGFQENGRAEIGDPASNGLEPGWSLDYLKHSWTGESLRLVPRRP